MFDLRDPIPLIDRIHDAPGGGYDNSFCLNSPGMSHPSAKYSFLNFLKYYTRILKSSTTLGFFPSLTFYNLLCPTQVKVVVDQR